MLTIGAFAKATQLSAKALRLYDELGLLVPVHVDSATGYRFYELDQLERARLVVWLRRLGMPLARILRVLDLPEQEAAAEVAAFWAQILAETASRQDLASFLVDYLSGKASTMSSTPTTLAIRYAARSDIGLVRTTNEDVAYAGPRLLAVADGFSGGRGGAETAGAAAIEALKPLEDEVPGDDVLDVLRRRVAQINEDVRAAIAADPENLDGRGTTLTAMLWSGTQLALVHIGDSRVYLIRDGELFPLTVDHTYVQSLVAEGRLSTEEARNHPKANLLVRALDGGANAEPDLSLHAARAGDRYLLCSDGLWAVADWAAVQAMVADPAAADPEQVVDGLIDLAIAAGGRDNVVCVVADVVEV